MYYCVTVCDLVVSIAEDYTVNAIDKNKDEMVNYLQRYKQVPVRLFSSDNLKDSQPPRDSNPSNDSSYLNPTEDIYHIMTDLMKDDVGLLRRW